MAVVLQLRGASAVNVAAGVSPIAELLACLHALAEPEHHLEAHAWLTQVRAAMSEDLRLRLDAFAPLWARRRCRLLYPLDLPLGRDLDAELDQLARMPLDIFTTAAALTVHGGDFDHPDVLADPAAFIDSCEQRSFSRGELARRLVADPRHTRTDLLRTLHDCAGEFFEAEWRRVAARLRDEAERGRGRLRALPLPEALASLSATATVGIDPPSVRFDKLQRLTASLQHRRCLLIPTVHGRPHLMVRADTGFPIVVHYPVAMPRPAPQEKLAQIRERLFVLSDPVRLALCRHLVNEPITTSELSLRTGMSRPQVSRHLSRLREVGLLVSRRSGRLVYHRLETRRLTQLGVDVLTTIVR
jgi:DNA-binding transcriptional ArsR family regulator